MCCNQCLLSACACVDVRLALDSKEQEKEREERKTFVCLCACALVCLRDNLGKSLVCRIDHQFENAEVMM